MKKIYLHIGSHKTGTTFIQNALHNNRAALKRQGFYYPGNDICHHFLYFITQQKNSLWPRQFKGIERQRLQRLVTTHLTQVAEAIKHEEGTGIVSSEYFFRSDESAIDNALSWLRDFINDIEVIVFVRNPVEHYTSFQQQMIKANHYLESPDAYHYPFRDVIQQWKKFCPVHVVKYEKGADSLALIAGCAGFSYEGFNLPPRDNESLCVEQMHLLEKLQRHLYPDHPHTFKHHLGAIHNFKGRNATKPEIKSDVARIVSENHKNDLCWLYDNYGIEFTSCQTVSDGAALNGDETSVESIFHVDQHKTQLYESELMDALLRKLTAKK